MSKAPTTLPTDFATYLATFGVPETQEARNQLAAHFRTQAANLATKAVGLEKAARLLETEGAPLPVESTDSQFLDWPDLDSMTIPATRLTFSIHGIDAPDRPLDGVRPHAAIDGNLMVRADEFGAIISWSEPWQSEPFIFSFHPLDEKDARRTAAVFNRFTKALIANGKRAAYHALVPAEKICDCCGEQPVRPTHGTSLEEIQNYRSYSTCCLCFPVVERGLAMGLKKVQVWNGRTVGLNSIPTDEDVDKLLRLELL